MESSDYPLVEPEKFNLWRNLKIKSEWFLFAALWSPAILMLIDIYTSQVQNFWKSIFRVGETAVIAWVISFALPPFILLSVAAVMGSKAQKIKPEGIK